MTSTYKNVGIAKNSHSTQVSIKLYIGLKFREAKKSLVTSYGKLEMIIKIA